MTSNVNFLGQLTLTGPGSKISVSARRCQAGGPSFIFNIKLIAQTLKKPVSTTRILFKMLKPFTLLPHLSHHLVIYLQYSVSPTLRNILVRNQDFTHMTLCIFCWVQCFQNAAVCCQRCQGRWQTAQWMEGVYATIFVKQHQKCKVWV